MTSRIPTLFISHGAPNLEITAPNTAKFFQQLGKKIKPKAIVCVSAHWNTKDSIQITNSQINPLIYDFYGFDSYLYKIKYETKGDPNLSNKIKDLLSKKFKNVSLVNRGLDHGSWIPLRLMYPEANIPIIQVSSPVASDEEEWKTRLFEMGKLLEPLRDENVLLVGSGGATHNLGALSWRGKSETPQWAIEFVDYLKKMLVDKSLLDGLLKHKHLNKAHPYVEHLLPIAFTLGASGDTKGKVIHDDYIMGSLSLMACQFD